MSTTGALPRIAVLGGTGKEGKGLAFRWAKAGYNVLIGSRSDQKASAAADELVELLGGSAWVVGMSNLEAANAADILVLAVPYAAHAEILNAVISAVGSKLLIDVTVPLVPGQLTKVRMPAAGSAAQEARNVLGPDAQVASAFQNIPHELLMQDGPIACDVLVTGTSKEARLETLKLVAAAGLLGWDAGPLENSIVTEGLASVLIHINRKYGSTHAGMKITGVDPQLA